MVVTKTQEVGGGKPQECIKGMCLVFGEYFYTLSKWLEVTKQRQRPGIIFSYLPFQKVKLFDPRFVHFKKKVPSPLEDETFSSLPNHQKYKVRYIIASAFEY